MADEKTLFNRDTDNDEKSESEEEMQLLADDEDFVDFSAAFDGEDDSDTDEEDEEDYEDFRPVPSLFRGLSFLKKRRNRDELPPEDEVEEINEEVLPITEETDNFEKDDEEKVGKPVDEEIVKGKNKNKKSFKGFSPFVKKEKEPESENKDTNGTEKTTEEQPVKEATAVVTDESVDDETAEVPDDEILLLEDSQEETDDVEEIEEEPKTGKRRLGGFGFLKRKIKEAHVQPEDTDEEAVEEITEESEFEILPSFEESTQEVESFVEEPEQIEEVVEITEEKEETVVIDEIPPFEANVEEKAEEVATEESAEEQVELIPPFEPIAEESNDNLTETAEEKIEELPSFEATIEENTEEAPEKQPEAVENEEKDEEKSAAVVMTAKDHLTFILIILALLLTIVFIVVKFIPLGSGDAQNSGVVTQAKDKVTEIQLQRENAIGHYIQSDIDDVFYVYSSENSPEFYQYNGKKMKSMKTTGTLNPVVEMGNEKISVKVDYIEVKGRIFGTGVFKRNGNQAVYLNDMIMFKLVNLPKGYEQDGKALLLATNNSEAVSKRCSIWNDSYIVDLETGKTTRFLTSDNSVFSSGYSVLTDEGYVASDGKILFFSTRDYDGTTNKRDIYIKANGKETRFAADVAGSFVYADGGTVSYLKATEKGFNVVRKENGQEKVIFSLNSDTSYLYHNEYLLDKYNGNLYNVRTGEKTVITGYGMTNPEMMTVSSDGKYLVVVGAVNSAIDYQVHIFDLKSGECAKYVDDNFSQHRNLAFVNDTTIIYSAVEPKQGYEYVMLDVSKAF